MHLTIEKLSLPKKSHRGNLQGFSEEKKGPAKSREVTQKSCSEKGDPSTPQCDGQATCFSESQKSSTFKAVGGDHRDTNPSAVAEKS